MQPKAGAVATRAEPAVDDALKESQRFGPVVSMMVPHAVSLWTRVLPPLHEGLQLQAEHARPSTSRSKNVVFTL